MGTMQPVSKRFAQVAVTKERTNSVRSRQLRFTSTGASFDPRLPFHAWQEIGRKVGRHASTTGWWLGDWLAFGQFKYGPRYREAIAATGLDYQTLRNYATVARRFEPARRRADLSFQHHAEVCALPNEDQDRLLALAAALGWSRNELRRQARPPASAITTAATARVLGLAVDRERSERWRRAAEDAGCSFEEWVVHTLDAAAWAHRSTELRLR
jgi:hypothetical protein